MIAREFAGKFAQERVDAWSQHDLKRVLSRYADDFEMWSPYIASMAGEPTGKLEGKSAMAVRWSQALERMPTLRFELHQALVGGDSATIYYQDVRGMVAEVFRFGPDGRVVQAAVQHAWIACQK